MRFARLSLPTALAALVSAMVFIGPLQAQQVYRIVGPDGRVTFSDKPPPDAASKPNVKPANAVALPGTPSGGGTALPFELRQIASRYPVTLYTGTGCNACAPGKSMLASRGIPFTEKTVNTNADIGALQRMTGAASLPFLTIGGQQIKGYSETEWNAFLDAAGYPKTSQLPSGYRQAAATPLVAVAAVAAPAPAEAPPAAPASDSGGFSAPAPATENPAGIRF